MPQFDRVRRLLRSRFGDAVRESLSAMAVCLRQPAGDSARGENAPAGWRKRSCTALVADVSGRILKAQAEMDRLSAVCLRSRPLAAAFEGNGPRNAAIDGTLAFIARRVAEATIAVDPHAYRLYARSVNAVSPHQWHLDLSNPLGALVLARALVACVADCLTSDEQRRCLATVLMDDCVVALRRAIDQTTAFMREIGVEPASVAIGFSYHVGSDGIGRSPSPESRPVSMKRIPATPGSAAAASNAAPGDTAPLTAKRAGVGSLSQTAAELNRTAQAARVVGPYSARDMAPFGGGNPEAAVFAVAGVEDDAVTFAHSVGMSPLSRESRQQYFAAVRAVLSRESCSATQIAAVELVGAMFDYVIDDRVVPVPLRPLIWRLQRPCVILALLDPGYLGDHPRSLRQLLENVGSLVGADGFDATSGSRQLRRLETVVRAVEIVSVRLAGRVKTLSQQASTEYERCAAGMAQLVERVGRDRRALESVPGHRNRRDFARRPGHEQERLATERLATLLTNKVSGQSLPDSVARFLQSVWLRYMRTALLHEGEHSNRFRRAETLVDELLWTLNAEPGAGDRRELAQRIPALIHQVNRGLREVGAQESEHQGFFDELFLIHLRKLQRLRAAGANSVDANLTESAESAARSDTGALPVLEHSMPGPQAALAAHTTGTGDGRSTDKRRANRRVGGRSGSDPEAAPGPVAQKPGGGGELEGHCATSLSGPASRLMSALHNRSTETSNASNDENLSEPSRPIGGNRLLSILQSVSLDDLPAERKYRSHAGIDPTAKIACGTWLDYTHSDGRVVSLKVAWLNEARSVALLVRHPDRRALSKSMAQLRSLFADGRLRILRTAAAA